MWYLRIGESKMKTRRKKSPQKSKTLQTTRYPRSSVTDNKDTRSMYLHNYKYIVIYSLESKQLVRWWKRYKSRALISSLVSRSCDKEPPSTQRPSLFDPTTSWTSKSPLPHFLLTLPTLALLVACVQNRYINPSLFFIYRTPLSHSLSFSLSPSLHLLIDLRFLAISARLHGSLKSRDGSLDQFSNRSSSLKLRLRHDTFDARVRVRIFLVA